ncbi:MAG: hypothetical protein COW42_06955 [Deltaproteobacteria bacterium CG17_big_fil_post_rev_8_21_14_2_50_63_7]|nr:MAG: hypothetical protein COW42_06955 [Deltaproteobacteria bacterium CG17_big_fil_post_rev_8_21_14_2_50_63_7]
MLPSEVFRTLKGLESHLREFGVPTALVGGFAVSVRAQPRFTNDVDLAVSVASDREAESLVWKLSARGFRLLVTLEHQDAGRISTVRMLAPQRPGEESLIVDLLFASSGIEAEIVGEAEVLEIMSGLYFPVASTGHLISMKVLSSTTSLRLQDQLDLTQLVAVASADELHTARESIHKIVRRGFGRGRSEADLLDALNQFLSR